MKPKALEETIETIDDLHRTFSDKEKSPYHPWDERTANYVWLTKWLPGGKEDINKEFDEIDLLLDTYRSSEDAVKQYLESRGLNKPGHPNTITCGYLLPREKHRFECAWQEGLMFHNKTIPDNFLEIMSVSRSNATPFLYARNAGITTPYLERLQEHAKTALESCREIKFSILDSDPRFLEYCTDSGYARDQKLLDLELLYLSEERKHLGELITITHQMKGVYRSVIDILSGVVERARSRGDLKIDEG